MNQIIRISYKSRGELKEDYFIKTKKGLIAIPIRSREFVSIPSENITKVKEVNVNIITGGIE